MVRSAAAVAAAAAHMKMEVHRTRAPFLYSLHQNKKHVLHSTNINLFNPT